MVEIQRFFCALDVDFQGQMIDFFVAGYNDITVFEILLKLVKNVRCKQICETTFTMTYVKAISVTFI